MDQNLEYLLLFRCCSIVPVVWPEIGLLFWLNRTEIENYIVHSRSSHRKNWSSNSAELNWNWQLYCTLYKCFKTSKHIVRIIQHSSMWLINYQIEKVMTTFLLPNVALAGTIASPPYGTRWGIGHNWQAKPPV